MPRSSTTVVRRADPTPLSLPLGFAAVTLRIDNPTGLYWRVAGSEVPPWTTGIVVALPSPVRLLYIERATPPGRSAVDEGGALEVVATDARESPSGGTTSPERLLEVDLSLGALQAGTAAVEAAVVDVAALVELSRSQDRADFTALEALVELARSQDRADFTDLDGRVNATQAAVDALRALHESDVPAFLTATSFTSNATANITTNHTYLGAAGATFRRRFFAWGVAMQPNGSGNLRAALNLTAGIPLTATPGSSDNAFLGPRGVRTGVNASVAVSSIASVASQIFTVWGLYVFETDPT